MELTDATAAWLIPSVATVAAVFIGGALTLLLGEISARGQRRRELAERALAAVTDARLVVASARTERQGGQVYSPPLNDVRSATAILASFDMLANTARGRDQRAIAAAGYHAHEWLLGGAIGESELLDLQAELMRLSWLLLAWERRAARGRDFRLTHAEARDRFAVRFSDRDMPKHTP